jgi:hypothetical protein
MSTIIPIPIINYDKKDINYNWHSLGNFPNFFISLHYLLDPALGTISGKFTRMTIIII